MMKISTFSFSYGFSSSNISIDSSQWADREYVTGFIFFFNLEAKNQEKLV